MESGNQNIVIDFSSIRCDDTDVLTVNPILSSSLGLPALLPAVSTTSGDDIFLRRQKIGRAAV